MASHTTFAKNPFVTFQYKKINHFTEMTIERINNHLRNSRLMIVALLTLTTLSNPAHSINWNTLGNQITTQPSLFPSQKPSLSRSPSTKPSLQPSWIPSASPSYTPSYSPSTLPSINPTTSPSTIPTYFPSTGPTKRWSSEPSSEPSLSPSISPTTASPSRQPSSGPSLHPTIFPTLSSSPSEPNRPSVSPSTAPSPFPSIVTEHPRVKEISTESQSPSVERITSSSPSENITSYTSKMNSHQTIAPSTMNKNEVQHQFLMELLSDKLMTENDVHHFEIEALSMITSSCQSLTDGMDFKSISFDDQHFSLAGGILIISFTIKGISRDKNDSSSDELEENIVTCFETHYSKLQSNVNAATGFFSNGIEVKEPKGTNFPTTIVSVIGGCCIVALAAIFLVDRRLRSKRKTDSFKKDNVSPKDKNEPNKDEKSRVELERNLSTDDYESNYNEIGYIKASSRLHLDISVAESSHFSQGLAIQALSPLAQAYDTCSLGDFSYPDHGDERLPAQGRGHEMHCIADSVTTAQSVAKSEDSCLSGMKESMKVISSIFCHFAL